MASLASCSGFWFDMFRCNVVGRLLRIGILNRVCPVYKYLLPQDNGYILSGQILRVIKWLIRQDVTYVVDYT
jgi:hypothetical protein